MITDPPKQCLASSPLDIPCGPATRHCLQVQRMDCRSNLDGLTKYNTVSIGQLIVIDRLWINVPRVERDQFAHYSDHTTLN